LSWRHFVIGTRAGQRHDALMMVRAYEATLATLYKEDARREWEETMRTQAGQR
jgi:hypothetical protein